MNSFVYFLRVLISHLNPGISPLSGVSVAIRPLHRISQAVAVEDTLTELLRRGGRQLIQHAIKGELAELLGGMQGK